MNHHSCILVAMIGIAGAVAHPPARGDTEPPRVVLGPGAEGLKVGPGMNAAGRDLRGCEFVGQDLTRAVFDRCSFYGARLEDCILTGASFRGAVFTGARVGQWAAPLIEGADFTDATLNGVEFTFYGDPQSLELSPAQFMSTRSYKTKDLRRCVIHGRREAVAFDFREADLREAWLCCGDFTQCDFTGAQIRATSFRSVRMTFCFGSA